MIGPWLNALSIMYVSSMCELWFLRLAVTQKIEQKWNRQIEQKKQNRQKQIIEQKREDVLSYIIEDKNAIFGIKNNHYFLVNYICSFVAIFDVVQGRETFLMDDLGFSNLFQKGEKRENIVQ